ncbi:MAG: hypothetical protein WC236_09695 [Gallionellaceae bacterium]|jgi:hypothetical protein
MSERPIQNVGTVGHKDWKDNSSNAQDVEEQEVLKLAAECFGVDGCAGVNHNKSEIIEFASKLRSKDAEKESGTTGNKYRAELYDEVWNKARDLGYANVTDALEEIASLKAQLAESNARLLSSAALIQQISARLSKGMQPDQAMLGLPQILDAQLAEAQNNALVDRDSRGMLVARLEHGSEMMTGKDVIAIINDCDMLANRAAPTYKKED